MRIKRIRGEMAWLDVRPDRDSQIAVIKWLRSLPR